MCGRIKLLVFDWYAVFIFSNTPYKYNSVRRDRVGANDLIGVATLDLDAISAYGENGVPPYS